MGPTAVAARPSAPLRPSASLPTDAENLGNHQLKIKHRSSKPILAWVQRKFAGAGGSGTVGKNAKDHHSRPNGVESTLPDDGPVSDALRPQRRESSHGAVSRSGSHHRQRHAGTHPSKVTRNRSSERGSTSGNKSIPLRKKVVRNQHSPVPLSISTGGVYNGPAVSLGPDSDPPSPGSASFSVAAPGSTWSNPPEADDDASIRPLPPTSPPSPAPSRSTHHTISSYTSGGYLSDPKTFRSVAASTKPTTLLSIDVGPAAVAHIAQAPPSISGQTTGTGTAPSSPTVGRFPSTNRHVQGLSGTSITFSTTGSRHPLAAAQVPESESDSGQTGEPDAEAEDASSHVNQAPNLSVYHPRNNPRPSSPPLDNASTLTLASSTFASPRQHGTPSIASRFPTSLSLGGGHRGSASMSGLVIDGYDGDADASVRALRPRSRRGSWGSVTSTETGWSAAVHALGPATRKLGGGSIRTGDDLDEERSIRHAQIDEEESPVAPSGDETSIDGDKRRQSVDPSVIPSLELPITLTTPTPSEEKDEPVTPVKAAADVEGAEGDTVLSEAKPAQELSDAVTSAGPVEEKAQNSVSETSENSSAP